MSHYGAYADFILSGHDVGIDFNRDIVTGVSKKNVVEKWVVIVYLELVYYILSELSDKVLTVHASVRAESGNEPDIMFRHTGSEKFSYNSLGNVLTGSGTCDVVKNDDGTLFSASPFMDGLGSYGAAYSLRNGICA